MPERRVVSFPVGIPIAELDAASKRDLAGMVREVQQRAIERDDERRISTLVAAMRLGAFR